MLRSDLSDYNDAYIVVTGKTTFTAFTFTITNPNNNAYDKKLAFKNNASFITCVSKVDNTLIDGAENLDVATPL